MKTGLRVHLPFACPAQPVLALLLTRITRLVTCVPGRVPS